MYAQVQIMYYSIYITYNIYGKRMTNSVWGLNETKVELPLKDVLMEFWQTKSGRDRIPAEVKATYNWLI